MELREYIRDIPDFPKEGIIFKDITPLASRPNSTPRIHFPIGETLCWLPSNKNPGRGSAGLYIRSGIGLRDGDGVCTCTQTWQIAIRDS